MNRANLLDIGIWCMLLESSQRSDRSTTRQVTNQVRRACLEQPAQGVWVPSKEEDLVVAGQTLTLRELAARSLASA